MNATRRQECLTMIMQARNFTRRENFSDAVARLRQVKSDVERSLHGGAEQRDVSALQALLRTIDVELVETEAQYAAWNDALAKRRQASIDNAAADFEKPFPPGV